MAMALGVPASGRAQSVGGVVDDFLSVQNAMITASLQTARGETAEAIATIDAALGTLAGIRSQLADPSVADELGKKVKKVLRGVDGTQKRMDQARSVIENGKKVRIQLKKLRVAAKSALKASTKAGRPVVAERKARTAGFHKPGETVEFQIYAADGTPCQEPPVVLVSNQGLSSAIDLDSVVLDEATGVLRMTMGQEQGGGSVTVQACGREATVLVYNYGPKIPEGLPPGFPTNLPKGNYVLTYSASGPGFSIPETSLGGFQLTSLGTFAKELTKAFNAAVSSVSVPGCGQSVGYSSFDGNSFTVNYSVTCSSGGVSVTVNVTFRITRV